MPKWVAVLALALVGGMSHAQMPELVRDIVTEGDIRDSRPRHFFSNGTFILFMAADQNGRELWRSDGTIEGTRLLKDIAAGAWSLDESYDPRFTASGDLVYFWSETVNRQEQQLWRTDGTSGGTFPITHHLAGDSSWPPYSRGELVAFGEDGAIFGDDWSVYITDGTVEGTRFLTDQFRADRLVRAGAYVYATYGRDLWRSDGTDAGTTLVTQFEDVLWDVEPPVVIGDAMYFLAESDGSGNRWLVYRSDGTAAGTKRIGSLEDVSAVPWTVVFDSTLYLLVEKETTTEIWKIDGEAAKTTVVDGRLDRVIAADDRMFFSTERDDGGKTLWRSDGTAAGTRTIMVVPPALEFMGTTATRLYFKIDHRFAGEFGGVFVHEIGGSGIERLTEWTYDSHHYGYKPFAALGERVAFPAEDDEHGEELWLSDGTPAGTRMLNIHHDHNSWGWLAQPFGSSILFRADGSLTGSEPWITDGTAAGTRLLADLEPREFPSYPARFTDLGNGRAVFRASFDRDLWTTDGTSGGTQLLKMYGDGHPFDSIDEPLPVLDGRAFFFVENWSNYEWQLWTTDGTAGGTALVEIVDAPRVVPPVVAGGLVYFASQASLWRSDGTDAGTFAVASAPLDLVASGDRVFFVANGLAHGAELWVTDGTLAGTHIVKDIRPGAAGAFRVDAAPEWWMESVEGGVIFSADDGVHGLEPWRSDGTEAGTVLVRDIVLGEDSSLLSMSEREMSASIGNVAYFTANDGVHGVELWRSDGTAEGTRLVRDIAPGAAWSFPTHLRPVLGRLYFSADDDAHGRELWWTSDTGTAMVADLAPGAVSSTPRSMIALGSSVLFFATTEATGDELWKFEPREAKSRAVRK